MRFIVLLQSIYFVLVSKLVMGDNQQQHVINSFYIII